MSITKKVLSLTAASMVFATVARAEDYVITLKGQEFSPANLTIPADKKVKITVKNTNPTAAEFESHELSREKVVGANSEISVFVGPVKAGTYGYFDDFQRDVAKGTITAQ